MNLHFIEIGGQKHPVSFTNYVQVLYQRNFKRSMAADAQKLAAAMQGLTNGDLSVAFVEELTNIAYVGIENGYAASLQPMPLSYKDLADALLDDAKAIEQITLAYLESLPKPSTDEAEKKTTPGATPAKRKQTT